MTRHQVISIITKTFRKFMKIKPITFAGLSLSLFGYLLVLALINQSILANTMSEQNLTILGLISIWVLSILLLIIVKFGEKRPYSSIGFRPITVKEVLIAIVIGIVLSLSVPLLTWLVSQIIPPSDGGINEAVINRSWGLILASILTAGITEELIFRGYIIERINEITKKKFTGILVSVIAFTIPHMVSWNMTHVIAVVLPLGLILSGIYLWKRNLVFNIIIHTMIDLPLVVMAFMST